VFTEGRQAITVTAMTALPDAEASPFLSGPWAPVADEIEAADLAVTGRLPEALTGHFVRNGPNPALPPLGRYHIFDGDGMLHGVHLDGGRARYRNRWIDSAGLRAERAAGHALFGGLNEYRLPDPEVLQTVGPMKNTANTHVVRHAGRTFALLEAAKPTEVTLDLETVGEYDFGGALSGPMTAHPKIDPDTGEMVFFGYSPIPPYLRVHVADAAGNLVRSVEVDLDAPVMMHDFGVSSRYVVLFDLPAVFDLESFLTGGAAIRWEPDRGSRFGLLDRRDLDAGVRWFDTDLFWMFHVLNAHDDGDAVVVDACRTDRLNVGFGEDGDSDRAAPPTLHRWRIDVATGAVTDTPLDDRPGDFPRVDDRRAGLPARYGYVAAARRWGDGEAEFDGFVRHDLDAGTSEVHRYGDGCVSGEPVFAPDPTRDDEDAGWILNYVTDLAEDRSDLVVVDAGAMEEVARVHLPRRVPLGFHGNWFATP